MKKFTLLFLLLALVGLPLGSPKAQAITVANPIVLTFEALGTPVIWMQGPFSSERLRFSLPANWMLQEGAELTLIAHASFAGEGIPSGTLTDYIGAALQVSFNGRSITSLPLRSGNAVYQVKIPAAALKSTRSDGRHEISLFLDAGIDCEYGFHHTFVEISGDSSITLPYAEAAISTDLRRLPYPIFQPDLVVPRSAVLIMPDAPSADELQAVLNVMAAFGRMSNRELSLTAIPLAELTEAMRGESHLIFVGKASSFPLLAQHSLPAPIQASRFNFSGLQDADGLLQMVPSPWNAGRTMLIVGGNSDEGVVKAAQALTTGTLLTSTRSDVSVVESVHPNLPTGIRTAEGVPLTSSDVTLAELGIDTQTVTFNSSGAGIGSIYVPFAIPPGVSPGKDAYLDLAFSNSALIDYERSGLTVYLNNTLVGSARLSEETTQGAIQRIALPLSAFRPGQNLITIDVALTPLDNCVSTGFENLWVTVFSDSRLHLPLIQATAQTVSRLRNLSDYPSPFTDDPTLGTTLFVLPEKDVQAWQTASALAYDLGGRSPGAIFNLEAVFNTVPETIRSGRHVIVVGQPSQLPILSELAESLPASFEPGSNIALLDNQHVVYRISTDKSLGYLELLISPWDERYMVLAVLGTTPEGVTFAGNALIVSSIRNTLKGNFAVIDGMTALVADTRIGTGSGTLAESLGPDMTIQPTPTPRVPVQPVEVRTGKDVIPALLGIVLFLIVVVVALAVWSSRKQKSM